MPQTTIKSLSDHEQVCILVPQINFKLIGYAKLTDSAVHDVRSQMNFFSIEIKLGSVLVLAELFHADFEHGRNID